MDTVPMNEAWIQTATGLKYPLLNPQPSDFNIRDIARALSHVCRFSGHCTEFYSVAQHSFLCSLMVDLPHRLDALMHDASEAYLGDVSRPLKHSPVMAGYRELEILTEQRIAEQFGLNFPFPPCVKEVDNRMLMTERRDLLGITHDGWQMDINTRPFDFTIEAWSCEKAEAEFLHRYHVLKERSC